MITVLAMTTLSYSSQSMVPSVPYVKAVDIYLIISFFFVFGSLLEYAILLNIRLRCVRGSTHKQQVIVSVIICNLPPLKPSKHTRAQSLEMYIYLLQSLHHQCHPQCKISLSLQNANSLDQTNKCKILSPI